MLTEEMPGRPQKARAKKYKGYFQVYDEGEDGQPAKVPESTLRYQKKRKRSSSSSSSSVSYQNN